MLFDWSSWFSLGFFLSISFRRTVSGSVSGSGSSYTGSSSRSRSSSNSLSRSRSGSRKSRYSPILCCSRLFWRLRLLTHIWCGKKSCEFYFLMLYLRLLCVAVVSCADITVRWSLLRSLSVSSVSSVSSASSSSSMRSADSDDMYADLASPVSSASSHSPTPNQPRKERRPPRDRSPPGRDKTRGGYSTNSPQSYRNFRLRSCFCSPQKDRQRKTTFLGTIAGKRTSLELRPEGVVARPDLDLVIGEAPLCILYLWLVAPLETMEVQVPTKTSNWPCLTRLLLKSMEFCCEIYQKITFPADTEACSCSS